VTTHPPAKALDTLRNASALLRSGQHVHAQQLLSDLLRAFPELAEAHWLLANSFSEVGDFAGAQRELHTCVRLAPHKWEAYIALGRLLASSGQVREAERILRQALQLESAGFFAVCALVRLLLMQNRAEEACALIEPVTRNSAASPELLMLYGHALMSLGKKAAAAAAFAQIVQAEPKNPDARFQLAAVLADSDQPTKAETEVRAGIAMGGKTPDAAFVLARALIGQGRFAEAETELLQVVRARPEHVIAQGNLSELVWMRCGNLDEAIAELDAALSANPHLSTLRIAKARLLIAAHLPERALAVIDAGLVIADADLNLLNAASQIALDFDAERAMDYVRRALRVAPEDHSALVTFGNASLAAGSAPQALETSEKLLRLGPDDGQALTMQADAWRMLGNARYHALADYAGFVRAEFIDVPEGWQDLPSYLAALACDVEYLHTLNAHPIGQSLRSGTQVDLRPEHSPHSAIRAFPQAIDGPLRRYMAAIGNGDDALRVRNTGRYQLHSAWSVRLQPGGFHTSHYHPQGWLSSACYIHLPPAIGSQGGEGWLQFGKPAFPTMPPLEAEYFLKPEPGLLVLFPSYMWHGTVPFSGNPGDNRLTIAFDVVPA
jgi:tetratricopeptide (TPR) repeat protein